VESVGTEAQAGHVRVELATHLQASSPILLQHGLLGSVVVEVERVSPATLLLRAAGQLVRPSAPAGS
jgi:membrane fusion protein (multidrug efflux system)